MTGEALAELIGCAEDAGIAVISDEIYHGLDYAFAAESAARFSPDAIIINSFSKYFCMTGWRIGWMVVPPALVRAIERLQQNLAISVPTLSQIAAEAAFDGRDELEAIKHGYEDNRRILVEALPGAGLTSFLPVDGAFYLYADISRFADDSYDFAKRMLEEAGVAATPGVDFDPVHGRHFLRLCYAGSREDMHEAVARIGELAEGRQAVSRRRERVTARSSCFPAGRIRQCVSPGRWNVSPRVETIGFDYGQRHAVELEVRPHIRDRLKSLSPQWRSAARRRPPRASRRARRQSRKPR